MALTQRQMEFLKKIVEIYRSTNLPMHYATIGKELGVSKWTAYDIMKRLEREGFLASEYALNPESKNVGRSIIVFYPTEKGLQRVEMSHRDSDMSSHHDDLHGVKERLMEYFEKKKTDPKKTKNDLLDEITQVDVPVVFGAYTIALLISTLYSETMIDPTFTRTLIRSGLAPELALSFFAGMSLGALKNVKELLGDTLVPYVVRFQDYISHYDKQEKEFLLGFLNEVLHKEK